MNKLFPLIITLALIFGLMIAPHAMAKPGKNPKPVKAQPTKAQCNKERKVLVRAMQAEVKEFKLARKALHMERKELQAQQDAALLDTGVISEELTAALNANKLALTQLSTDYKTAMKSFHAKMKAHKIACKRTK